MKLIWVICACLLSSAAIAQKTTVQQPVKESASPVSRQRQQQALQFAREDLDRQAASAGSRADKSDAGNMLMLDEKLRLFKEKLQRQQQIIERARERAKVQTARSWQRAQLSEQSSRLRFEADRAGSR